MKLAEQNLFKSKGLYSIQARRHEIKSGPAEVRASAEGTSGGEHERGYSPCCKGVRGISPEKIFNLWLPLCAFLMDFGCVLAGISAVFG